MSDTYQVFKKLELLLFVDSVDVLKIFLALFSPINLVLLGLFLGLRIGIKEG